MKLGFVTHKLSTSGGGVSSVVEALSQELSIQNVQARVFGLADAAWENEINKWQGAPAVGHSIRFPKALGCSPSLKNSLTSFYPDVVHSHGIWIHTSSVVADLGRAGTPYIVSPHGMLDPAALQISRWKKRLAHILFESRHLKNAHCTHALNKAELAAIRSYGIEGPVALIPNGVNLPKNTQFTAVAPWAGTLPADAKTLLYLGRLHPKKNVESLLRALSILKSHDSLSGWQLAIAGWGEKGHDTFLQTLSEELNLTDRVAFLGPMFGENKSAAFSNADAFILPSFSEGLPMSVLEAWSHSLPVIMTHECNLPEGFAANAAYEIGCEPKRMAQELSRVFGSRSEDLLSVGRNGHELVKSTFTWEAVANSFIRLYRWVLGEGPKPEFVFEMNEAGP